MFKRLTTMSLMLFLVTIVAMAQQKVTGTVIFATDGEPMIGAAVEVVGTKTKTVTDMNGKFTIAVEPGKKIKVSYVGCKPVTVAAKNGMKISIEDNSKEMTEVVVNGFQRVDKRLSTGAATKVSAESVKLDGMPDVSRALEGRVAGVSVQNVSGTFGTAPKIRVRGATSIYGSSKPLWVIDGVIQEEAVEVSADDLSSGDATTLISNAIAGLSADDIESFTILKDGSATSIYGARAMAGVVVITTKRGRPGHSTINYTGEFTMRMKPSYRDYNICNSQEQMGIYKEMEAKGWLEYASLANGASSGLYGAMYNMLKTWNPETGQFEMAYNQAAMNSYLRQAEFRNTDWFDLLFKNSIMQNHSVSITTGTEKGSLYSSISLMNDPGWYIDSNVRRFTATLNADYNVSKWVTLSLRSNASYIDQKAPGTMARNTDPVSGSVSRNFDINPFSYAMNTSRTLDPRGVYKRNYAPFNIFDELDNNYIDKASSDIKFQGEALWKPIRALEIKAMGAYRVNNNNLEHIILEKSNQAEAYRAGVDDPNVMYSNTYLYSDPDEPNSYPVSVMPTGGIYVKNTAEVRQMDFRTSAQYNNVWNDKHILNLFAGMDVNKTDRDQDMHQQYGVDYNNGRIVNITPKFFKQAKEEGTVLASFNRTWTRSLAYYANGTYSYGGRYVMNGTYRYEGTNKLGRSHSARWLPTWNVSGAWNLHEEGFFKNFMERRNGVMSHATMRLSYSLTGDRGPSWVTNALPVINSTQVWRPEGDQMETALELTNLANTELTYEKKHEFNMGFDLGFFKNRLNITTEVYWRNNFDLIGIQRTEGHGGMISKWANVATMKSKGAELTISSHNIKTKDWMWDTDLTFSWNKNKITDLKSRSNVIDLVTGTSTSHFRQGYAQSALFSIPFVRLNDEGIPVIINEKGEETTTDIYFQEYENLDFLKYEGPTEPPITGGFNNIVRWKNFRLNVFFTYNFGNAIRLDPCFSSSYSDQSAMTKEFKNRWVIPGDESVTRIPAIASRRQVVDYGGYLSYAYNAYNYSTERCASGSFIRLKDISLTYDLPAKFLNRIGLATASLKIDATNMWLVYADKKLNGQDPEYVNAGGVSSPLSKQFTFTIRMGIK